MTFKIGDKVLVHDGSWSIVIRGTKYDTGGVCGIMGVSGTVIATDCRLPIGPSYVSGTPTPMEGMPIQGHPNMFHDLLVQTEDGFVFTSTRHVKLVPVEPKKYFVCVLGVMVEVTKVQYEAVEEAENEGSGSYFTGTYNVEDWR